MKNTENPSYHTSTERTPLLITAPSIESINNPLQERIKIKKQKVIYSAITLADIFQKVVNTSFIASFLLFTYTYLDLDYKNSLAVFYLFGFTTQFFTAIINSNIEHFLSRQNAIVAGFLIYTFGLGGLTAFTAHANSARSLSVQYLVLVPLFLICLGEGLCKSCITVFTILQFDLKLLPEKLSFFLTKLFWIGHIGALVLALFLLGIVEFMKFEMAYGLFCICLLAGLLVFMAAWNRYEIYGRNASSVNTLIWAIIKDAKQKKNLHIEQRKRASSFHESYEGRDFVGHWIDYAKHSFGGSFTDTLVDQTKAFIKISLLFLSFIPYWVANSQVYGSFIFQNFHLHRKIGSFRIPVIWMALFHVASIIIFVKVLDKAIVPFCRRNGITFSTQWKISIGMVFGILAMVAAAFVEIVAHSFELDQPNHLYHVIGQRNISFTNVHILWTIPQFSFLGISEVLVGLTGLSISNQLCQGILQKAMYSVYYFTISVGFLISFLLIELGLLPVMNDDNQHNMVVFFLAMAGCCVFSLVLFSLVIWKLEFDKRPVVKITSSKFLNPDSRNVSIL